MSKLSDEREAEFRASGWSDAEIRDYKRGYESAVEDRSWVPAVKAPAPPPEFIRVADRFPRNSERRLWERETDGGKASQLLPAVDDAAELAEAKRLREDREYCYETEAPSLAAFRVAVRHNAPRVVVASGTTDEVAQTLASVGIACTVGRKFYPPSLAGPAQVNRV